MCSEPGPGLLQGPSKTHIESTPSHSKAVHLAPGTTGAALVPQQCVHGSRHVSLMAQPRRQRSARGGTGKELISPLPGLQWCNKSPCVLHAREVQGRGERAKVN